jgi:hypothetical protein
MRTTDDAESAGTDDGATNTESAGDNGPPTQRALRYDGATDADSARDHGANDAE